MRRRPEKAQDEEVVIELTQTTSAVAASEVTSSAAVPVAAPRDALPTHGRLGVVLTTMPGMLAADVQLARVEVPPWVVGAPLEVGLDLVGNLEAGGAGVSVGDKAFAFTGAWSTWDGRERGIALGAGLRF
ncbi:hypothetical protein J7643_19195 [bacterium]|nr:hypothetical protein [bacterium]